MRGLRDDSGEDRQSIQPKQAGSLSNISDGDSKAPLDFDHSATACTSSEIIRESYRPLFRQRPSGAIGRFQKASRTWRNVFHVVAATTRWLSEGLQLRVYFR